MKREGAAQALQLGIHRSDYMFDVGHAGQDGDPSAFRLTQIEINTIAAAFGALSSRLYGTHRRILRRFLETVPEARRHFHVDAVPRNPVADHLAGGMLLAVDEYRRRRRIDSTTKLAIVFVDTEVRRNVFDQRLVEYAVYDQNEAVVVLRKTLCQAETDGSLDETSKILMMDDFEVALVYYRSGYSPDQYPSGEETVSFA